MADRAAKSRNFWCGRTALASRRVFGVALSRRLSSLGGVGVAELAMAREETRQDRSGYIARSTGSALKSSREMTGIRE